LTLLGVHAVIFVWFNRDGDETPRHGGARAAAMSWHAGSVLNRARPSCGKTGLALLGRDIGSSCYRRWR
jgi:hypothetical protein